MVSGKFPSINAVPGPPPGLEGPPGLESIEEFQRAAHTFAFASDDLGQRIHDLTNEYTDYLVQDHNLETKWSAEPEAWNQRDSSFARKPSQLQDDQVQWPWFLDIDGPDFLSGAPALIQTDALQCEQEQACHWHESAKSVGTVSEDGHVFTNTGGAERLRTGREGLIQRLSSICMVFDETLRSGGTHRYSYQILDGEVGPADGAGFVFDTKVRRNNIQRMRTVFLNQRGQICLRNHAHVRKLDVHLPPLQVGMQLNMIVCLDTLHFHFVVCDTFGEVVGIADLGLDKMMDDTSINQCWHSGFFCAVVTKDISIFLA